MAKKQRKKPRSADGGAETKPTRARRWPWLVLLVVLLLATGVRLRLADVPLERDEGEYAYAGQLILAGLPPYEHLYNMKLPGIYAAYAGLITLFGPTHTGVHVGLAVMNAATGLILFLLARRLFDDTAGVAAAACFAMLSIGPSVQGVFANAEHFVILPMAAGLLVLVEATERDRPWLVPAGGALLGLAFLMKQHGAAFIVMGGLYLLWRLVRSRPIGLARAARRFAAFAAGALLPYGLTCLILAAAGVFDRFWFWTVEYASEYAAQLPWEAGLSNFKARALEIGGAAWPIWLLAGLGLAAPAWSRGARRRTAFLVLFAAFSLLAVAPGFYFRPHYFVLLLPAAAVLAGCGVSALTGRLGRFVPLLIVAVAVLVPAYAQRDFLFRLTPEQVARRTYGFNPFPESLEVARYIEARTTEDDRIVVIGSEPQIYFYSGRRAATGYIYMYAMMEEHEFALEMQEQMIREVEAAEPAYLVVVPPRSIPWSWLPRRNSHTRLLEWAGSYTAENYRRVGLVELYREGPRYRWDDQAAGPSRSRYWIEVFERR